METIRKKPWERSGLNNANNKTGVGTRPGPSAGFWMPKQRHRPGERAAEARTPSHRAWQQPEELEEVEGEGSADALTSGKNIPQDASHCPDRFEATGILRTLYKVNSVTIKITPREDSEEPRRWTGEGGAVKH